MKAAGPKEVTPITKPKVSVTINNPVVLHPRPTICLVYGTLKGMAYGKFLGHAVTTELFHLWSGGFPVVLPASADDELAGYLTGEVYSINAQELQFLDSYEGYPNLYGREEYEVKFKTSNATLKAWIYTGNQIKAHLGGRARVVPGEDRTLYWQYGAEKPATATILG